MRLRLQLALFALLTLVLPWAGWRYVLEMEQTLRRGLEQSLVASAGTVAAAIDGEPVLQARGAGQAYPPLYAQRLARAPNVDGFLDDWSSRGEPTGRLDGGHRFWVGVHGANAYVFVDAADTDLVYQAQPGATPYGDRVLLSLTPDGGPRSWLLLATRAPGMFRAQRSAPPAFAPSGRFEERVLAAWQETSTGYAAEVRLPLAAARAALGIAVIDVDSARGGYSVKTSTSWQPPDAGPGPLLFQSEALRARLAEFTRAGERFRVVDRDGYVLGDVGSLDDARAAVEPAGAGPAERLIRLILRGGDPEYAGLERPPGRLGDPRLRRALAEAAPATAWYGRAPGQSAVVAAAVPIRTAGGVAGAVVLERTSEAILTLTNQALVRLVTLTVAASAGAVIALLGYATYLSLRVRGLARAAEQALGPRGEIRTALPGRRARDEIGDLARSFAGLLGRLREYTDYQRTLTSTLSHELRTPAAIISTSLDNLEHELGSPAAPAYLERIRQGAHRLDAILAAMSEATRIEQAVRETEPRRFELADVVEACCAAYGDIYPERRFDFRRDAGPTTVTGSEDLIAQMLDKLVDNAVGFSPAGSTIGVRVERRDGEVGVRVTNAGSRLPEEMRGHIFDSLVSVRSRRDERPHLGLGLHIVALIAEFHGGTAEADNLPDGSGVEFAVWMKRAA